MLPQKTGDIKNRVRGIRPREKRQGSINAKTVNMIIYDRRDIRIRTVRPAGTGQ